MWFLGPSVECLFPCAYVQGRLLITSKLKILLLYCIWYAPDEQVLRTLLQYEFIIQPAVFLLLEANTPIRLTWWNTIPELKLFLNLCLSFPQPCRRQNNHGLALGSSLALNYCNMWTCLSWAYFLCVLISSVCIAAARVAVTANVFRYNSGFWVGLVANSNWLKLV